MGRWEENCREGREAVVGQAGDGGRGEQPQGGLAVKTAVVTPAPFSLSSNAA